MRPPAIIVAWFLVSRWKRLYATPAAAIVALLLIGFSGSGGGLDLAGLTPRAVWTTPVFSVGAMISLALPLFIVTMASQNLPGVAVLAAFGYRPSPGPLIATTAAFSFVAAPFGGHSVYLSSIIAAMCAGDDASPDPARRWIAAASNGAACVVLGLGGRRRPFRRRLADPGRSGRGPGAAQRLRLGAAQRARRPRRT